MTNEELKTQYPAIEFAYPIAVNSYDVALKRLDCVFRRIVGTDSGATWAPIPEPTWAVIPVHRGQLFRCHVGT